MSSVLVYSVKRNNGAHDRPKTGWTKGELKGVVLTKEGRYGDLKGVAGVG
jgi:hypothetical protein